MAASSALTNTGLTGLRSNVLSKWVESLSCTVSKLGLKNPHKQEFWAQGGRSPTLSREVHPPEQQCSMLSVFVQSLHPHQHTATAHTVTSSAGPRSRINRPHSPRGHLVKAPSLLSVCP